MTALARQVSRFGRLLRRSSTGNGGARSNIKRPAQIGQASSLLNEATRSFSSCLAIGQRAAASRHQAPASSAALKSP